MSISKYLKEIGRGKEGARSLSAEQAEDLMTQVLEGRVTDLEVGAFAIAMRIKGETPTELAAFLAVARRFAWPRRRSGRRSGCPATTAPASCPT